MRARAAELWGEITLVVGMLVMASRAAWRRIAGRMVSAGGAAAVEEMVEEILASEAVRTGLVTVIQEVNAPVLAQLEAIHAELAEIREWRGTARRMGDSIDQLRADVAELKEQIHG